jgi:hypothetical protein
MLVAMKLISAVSRWQGYNMITANGLIQLGFVPDVDFRVEDDGSGAVIKEWWSASPQPSEAEIEAADVEWQAGQDATQYQRDRQTEYPSIDELVVAMWEGVVEERMASVTRLEGVRQAIKEKYPK